MEKDSLALFRDVVSKLIVPAFITKGETIVAVNAAALERFPAAIVGGSALLLFPEVTPVFHLPSVSFDLSTYEGPVGVNITPLSDYKLWQFTLGPEFPATPEKVRELTKTEITMLMAQINLLSTRCPQYSELCAGMYRNCCRLLKTTATFARNVEPSDLYTCDFAKELTRFSTDSASMCEGLGLKIVPESLPKFVFISSNRLDLDNLLASVLCLCIHSHAAEIAITLEEKGRRAVASFRVRAKAEGDREELPESDRHLTLELIKKYTDRLDATFFQASDENDTVFVLSLPIARDDNYFSAPPTHPAVGIPPQLIHLSALLPLNYYIRL
ncbi:MAG: hypothetical protein IKZ19_09410 [Clostridia bacterium]|nr:hypothetical protein [Clostridia bacterium]